MQTYEVNFKQVIDMAVSLASERKEGFFAVFSDDIGIGTGRTDGTYDKAICQERNLPVFHSEHIGGTIVLFPGDISFLELSLSYSDFGKDAIKAIESYLQSIGLQVRRFGNDLMLYSAEEKEWFKVASYGSGWISKGYLQTAVHVSIGMDEELVSKICTKPCQKKPRGLARYGIKAQEIYNVIKLMRMKNMGVNK